MAGAPMLAVERQATLMEMRLRTGYLNLQTSTLDEAPASAREHQLNMPGILG
jgi:urocanate hydratase